MRTRKESLARIKTNIAYWEQFDRYNSMSEFERVLIDRCSWLVKEVERLWRKGEGDDV